MTIYDLLHVEILDLLGTFVIIFVILWGLLIILGSLFNGPYH